MFIIFIMFLFLNLHYLLINSNIIYIIIYTFKIVNIYNNKHGDILEIKYESNYIKYSDISLC